MKDKEEKTPLTARIFNKEEAVLSRTDKLFQKSHIEDYITVLSPQQAVGLAVFDSFHEMLQSGGEKRFCELFTKKLKTNNVSIDGRIRDEFLKLYEPRSPQTIYQSAAGGVQIDNPRPTKSIQDRLLGK